MNLDIVLSLTLAAMCVLAVGISATTLESSLSTDPDDVIDIAWDKLPISQDTAILLEREIRGEQDDRQRDPEAGDADQESRQAGGAGDDEERPQGSEAGSEDQPRNQQDQASGQQPREPNFWERLLALLRELLPWIAGLGILLAAAALAYRYRSRLRALVASILGGRPGEETDGEESVWADGEPATEIDRMWLALVRHVDPDDPSRLTVTDVADRAIEAGLDPEAVTELAAVFGDVRYGGEPATERKARRAAEAYRTLDLESGADDHPDRPSGRRERPAPGGGAA